MNFLLVIVAAYLIGSIPFSHIFPSLKGKDVRAGGTKNVGATNALVVAGPLMGALALVGDVGKGFLAVYLAQRYLNTDWSAALAGLAAVAGHDFSIFLKFKGGKGVATTGGALLAFDWAFGLIILLFWIMMILVTRYFILSTLIVLGILPIILLAIGWKWAYIVFAAAAFLLSLYTHRQDIKRIVSGQELTAPELINRYRGA